MDITAGGDTKGIGDFIKLPGTVILLMLCVTSFYGAMGTYVMTGDWVVSTVSHNLPNFVPNLLGYHPQ